MYRSDSYGHVLLLLYTVLAWRKRIKFHVQVPDVFLEPGYEFL